MQFTRPLISLSSGIILENSRCSMVLVKSISEYWASISLLNEESFSSSLPIKCTSLSLANSFEIALPTTPVAPAMI